MFEVSLFINYIHRELLDGLKIHVMYTHQIEYEMWKLSISVGMRADYHGPMLTYCCMVLFEKFQTNPYIFCIKHLIIYKYIMYCTPKEARIKYGVSNETLKRWEQAGKIKAERTAGKHRRYQILIPNTGAKKIVYARVSSQKQAGDLERQVNYVKEQYPDYEVKTDIGSGINFQRKEFRWILEQLFERNIQEVVVASSDRFARMSGGSEFFGWLFERFGGKLTILQNISEKTNEQRMAEDIIEIITSYAAKYHGARKYGEIKGDDEGENTPEPHTDDVI